MYNRIGRNFLNGQLFTHRGAFALKGQVLACLVKMQSSLNSFRKRDEKITLLFKIKPTKLPNQLLIKSIDKPQILLFYVLEYFHCCTFFTSGKCVGVTLMMLPLKGYSITLSIRKGDKGGCKQVSAPAQAKQAIFLQLRMACVWGEMRFKKS